MKSRLQICALAAVVLTAPAYAADTAKDTTFYMGTTETGRNVPLEMVFVPGGTFTMGCTPEQGNDCKDDEKPAHSVTVSDFYIGKYEIMQDQWMLVMGKDPSFHYYKNPHWPVENVSWDDVQEFIARLNAMTGKKYRLPTEAEWEYAARGGSASKGFKYSGGNRISDVQKKRSAKKGEERLGHPSGASTVPNELGIYFMSGCVWEWVSDWYGSYGGEPQTDPAGPPSGKRRVVRGGSWYSGPKDDRVSNRSSSAPGSTDVDRGFRLALSPEEQNTFIDTRDGKTYRTAKIGEQVWMAENLNYQTDNSWCYKNAASNCNKYGRLYVWKSAAKACPDGWHLPTREEWDELVAFAGDKKDEWDYWARSADDPKKAGTKLKSKSPDWNGTDNHGFSAMPGGGKIAYSDDWFYDLNSAGRWWTATQYAATYAYYCRGMSTNYSGVSECYNKDAEGLSVRCLLGAQKPAEDKLKTEIVTGSFTDARDGKRYRTVKLNDQTWMAENLNYRTDSSWCYDNSASNCAKYGRLYSWNAAMGACPAGWHLPARDEWAVLLALADESAMQLKSKSSDWSSMRLGHWKFENHSTDRFGFSARPGGIRYPDGWGNNSQELGWRGYWWTATQRDSSSAYNLSIETGNNFDLVYKDNSHKAIGLSVRCLKD